ncbi:GDSL-like Lipase/Acylhydrolase family protein [Chitinophaga sp. YR573]|uniref:SGNH/GDSL hydrolase family protein n=1 Tax=Chitinophaga sp. YR573 TaxID=1881040 RepID=UPI0008B9347E|nr:SGNH/GDSL hydrolase family protein [Chitinophaga sp. YR573]SEW35622.1 GDSL-like Lipase/Acylhydrolase family protein [Chitinophaga sp. YR573]
MSFYPLALPVSTTGSFIFKDITPDYPLSPIGYGAPDAPTNVTAITSVWGEVQVYGGDPVQSTTRSGNLTDSLELDLPISQHEANIIQLYYGELISLDFSVSEDRLTITTEQMNLFDGVKGISLEDAFPAKIDTVENGVISLLTPLNGTIGTHLFRFFNVQVNVTPPTPTAAKTKVSAERVPPAASKLAMSAWITNNGFKLKWANVATDLSTAPKFVAIGSSTFAGSGASVYANSVAGKLSTQLSTGVLCNNALSLQDTRNGLPNGADPAVRENRNISMALAANPTAIIIAFPTNDIGNGLTPAQFRDNILTMYTLARQRGIPAFVISPQPRTGYTVAQQNNLLAAAALIKDIIPVEFYVDVMEALRDPNSIKPADINPIYNADNIHPNDAGHAVMFNILWNLISTYFINPVYTSYTIETSTDGVYWTIFDSLTAVTQTYPRINGNQNAYRVTATNPDTTPSDPVWIYQPIASGTVEQTVQIDPSLDTVIAPPVSWNNFSAPAAGPALNQSMVLTDNLGAASGITATVTRIFTGASAGGANSGVYPQRVMSDNWYLSSTFLSRAQLQLSGLLPGNVYNLEFTSSKDTTVIDKIICLSVSDGTMVDKRDSLSCTTAPNVPNQFVIRTLEGIVPTPSGTMLIDIYCAGSLSYLTGIVLRRMSN